MLAGPSLIPFTEVKGAQLLISQFSRFSTMTIDQALPSYIPLISLSTFHIKFKVVPIELFGCDARLSARLALYCGLIADPCIHINYS